MENHPFSIQGDLRNLPGALGPLQVLPNWVCWKWTWRAGRTGVGTWSKPPFQSLRPETFARNDDPATWGTYEDALAVFEAGRCDGIGFNLWGTDYAAFDIDNCRDRDSGIIAPEARAVVDEAASYTEITVSGTGLRVIGVGKLDELHRQLKISGSAVEVEIYRRTKRYIVITGNPLDGTWPHLAVIDAALDAVVERLDCSNPRRERKADRGRVQDRFCPLPEKLRQLVENGVAPAEDLSAAFHHVVCRLHELGIPVGEIERLIVGKPIVPARFSVRLAGEIQRSLLKAKPQLGCVNQDDRDSSRYPAGKPPLDLFWHGEKDGRQARSWLVRDLIPEKGHGLAAGQWGAAKTFAMIDLCASIMTGQPFAGREIVRRGGVLFVAAEGACEIPIRLQGVIDHKIKGKTPTIGGDRLPFAWIEEDPSLKDDKGAIAAAADAAAARMQEQFGLPLVLIVFDTLNAVARFKDGNDAAEAQFVMNQLNNLSKATGAFVLAVDHFGKAVETGTRGSSAKEASSDVVLAFLAERDTAGSTSNRRMAVRKLRGGKTGEETNFELRVVQAGFDETTCVIDWSCAPIKAGVKATKGKVWPKSTRLLRATLHEVLLAEGKDINPIGDRMVSVKAVTVSSLRKEFTRRYLTDGTDAKKGADAKRSAFNRALRMAQDQELISARDVDGVDHVWPAADDSGPEG